MPSRGFVLLVAAVFGLAGCFGDDGADDGAEATKQRSNRPATQAQRDRVEAFVRSRVVETEGPVTIRNLSCGSAFEGYRCEVEFEGGKRGSCTVEFRISGDDRSFVMTGEPHGICLKELIVP